MKTFIEVIIFILIGGLFINIGESMGTFVYLILMIPYSLFTLAWFAAKGGQNGR